MHLLSSVDKRKQFLGFLAAFFLGGVLLFAAYAKLIEPASFLEQVHLEGLDFLLPAASVALIAILLETSLGVALLLGLLNRWVIYGTSALSVFFIYLTGHNYWLVSQGLRDPSTSCGCFGSLIERTPQEAFWQDLFLLGIPLLIIFWCRPKWNRFNRLRSLVSIATGLVAVILMVRSPGFTTAADAIRFGQDVADHSFYAHKVDIFVDGEGDESAKVYFSEARASFLIQSQRFVELIVLDLKKKEFQAFSTSSVRSYGENNMDLVEKPEPLFVGSFTMGAGGVSFSLRSLQVTLVPR